MQLLMAYNKREEFSLYDYSKRLPASSTVPLRICMNCCRHHRFEFYWCKMLFLIKLQLLCNSMS